MGTSLFNGTGIMNDSITFDYPSQNDLLEIAFGHAAFRANPVAGQVFE
jgi:hypothetical protein